MRSLTIFTTLSLVGDLYDTFRAEPSLSDANAFHRWFAFPARTETFAFQIVDAALGEFNRSAHAKAVTRESPSNEEFNILTRTFGSYIRRNSLDSCILNPSMFENMVSNINLHPIRKTCWQTSALYDTPQTY